MSIGPDEVRHIADAAARLRYWRAAIEDLIHMAEADRVHVGTVDGRINLEVRLYGVVSKTESVPVARLEGEA
jgi:hypothetical protein